jgi:type VI secretion system protein ImpL
VELFNEPGQFGLKRMVAAAQRRRKDDGSFELRWAAGNAAVAVDLKIVSSPDADGAAQASGKGFHGLRLPPTIVGRGAEAQPPAVASLNGAP